MSEKRFKYNSDDSLPCITDSEKDENCLRMSDIVNVLNEQQATIKQLQDFIGETDAENIRLRQEIKKLKEEEKLYAQEILRLNELLKQYQSFKDLGGDY